MSQTFFIRVSCTKTATSPEVVQLHLPNYLFLKLINIDDDDDEDDDEE